MNKLVSFYDCCWINYCCADGLLVGLGSISSYKINCWGSDSRDNVQGSTVVRGIILISDLSGMKGGGRDLFKYSRAIPIWVNLLQWSSQLCGLFCWSGQFFGCLFSTLVVATCLTFLVKLVEFWLVPSRDGLIPKWIEMITMCITAYVTWNCSFYILRADMLVGNPYLRESEIFWTISFSFHIKFKWRKQSARLNEFSVRSLDSQFLISSFISWIEISSSRKLDLIYHFFSFQANIFNLLFESCGS